LPFKFNLQRYNPGQWESANGFYPPAGAYEYVRCQLCQTAPVGVLGEAVHVDAAGEEGAAKEQQQQ
jgi:hypothetical protein